MLCHLDPKSVLFYGPARNTSTASFCKYPLSWIPTSRPCQVIFAPACNIDAMVRRQLMFILRLTYSSPSSPGWYVQGRWPCQHLIDRCGIRRQHLPSLHHKITDLPTTDQHVPRQPRGTIQPSPISSNSLLTDTQTVPYKAIEIEISSSWSTSSTIDTKKHNE